MNPTFEAVPAEHRAEVIAVAFLSAFCGVTDAGNAIEDLRGMNILALMDAFALDQEPPLHWRVQSVVEDECRGYAASIGVEDATEAGKVVPLLSTMAGDPTFAVATAMVMLTDIDLGAVHARIVDAKPRLVLHG